MKNSLLVPGFSSLVVAALLYAVGYSNYNYVVGSVQVLIFPAAFFALLGLLLLSGAARDFLESWEK